MPPVKINLTTAFPPQPPQPQPILPPLTPQLPVNVSPKDKHQPKTETTNSYAAAIQELEGLVGLEDVKKIVQENYAFALIKKRREEYKLDTPAMSMHMVFKGNPGTGKTTVARIMARLFHGLGLVSKGQLVEVERADLVGEYIGHTAQRTKDALKRAQGGILFIDEAYSLARGGEKDFGREAIDTLVKGMEDLYDQVIVILAGYRREMEYFLRTNPGLSSRFPIQLDFPDYTVEELTAIGRQMLKDRNYLLNPEGAVVLKRILTACAGSAGEYTGNARLVRNLIEKALRCQAVRLMDQTSYDRQSLMLVTGGDLEQAFAVLSPSAPQRDNLLHLP